MNRGGSAGATQPGEEGREDERDLMRGRIREKKNRECVYVCEREREGEPERERRKLTSHQARRGQ